MTGKPLVLSLFGKSSLQAAWEPLLSQFPGSMAIIGDAETDAGRYSSTTLGFVPDLAVISSDLYPNRGSRVIESLRAENPQLDIVILASIETPRISLLPLVKDRVCHFAVADPERDMDRVRELLRTLTANEPWKFASYLHPGSDFHEWCLYEPQQKERIISHIEDLITGSGYDLDLLRQQGVLLADEMIENALQAAPNNELSEKGIIIKAGFDGETLALQVIDKWGTLTPEKALEYMARLQDGQVCLDLPRGRGLFILWQFFDHFHVNIISGRETAVGGELKRKSTLDHGRLKGFDFFHHSCSGRSHGKNLSPLYWKDTPHV